MDQSLTYISMAVTLVVAGIALYKARQPLELGRSWHVPWNGILFLGLLVFLLLLRHQLTLSGIDLPAR